MRLTYRERKRRTAFGTLAKTARQKESMFGILPHLTEFAPGFQFSLIGEVPYISYHFMSIQTSLWMYDRRWGRREFAWGFLTEWCPWNAAVWTVGRGRQGKGEHPFSLRMVPTHTGFPSEPIGALPNTSWGKGVPIAVVRPMHWTPTRKARMEECEGSTQEQGSLSGSRGDSPSVSIKNQVGIQEGLQTQH